jgi:hypothetical protein
MSKVSLFASETRAGLMFSVIEIPPMRIRSISNRFEAIVPEYLAR